MSEFDHLRPLARRHAIDGHGTVGFSICPACGQLSWAGSSPEPKDDLVIRAAVGATADYCAQCSFISRRFPEVFNWVEDVVKFQISQAQKKYLAALEAQSQEGGA